MNGTERKFLAFLIVVLVIVSTMLGYEIARVSDSIKAEVIQQYKSGSIDCQTVGGSLACRSVIK